MIRGEYFDGVDWKLLFEQGRSDYEVQSCEVTYAVNSVDTCTLTLPRTNVARDFFRGLPRVVKIRDGQKEVFRGSTISSSYDVNGDLEINLDGALGWLRERVKPPFFVNGYDIQQYISALVTQHADKSTPYRWIQVGMILMDGLIWIDHREEYYSYFELLSELVKKYGGYFYVSYGGDYPKLNYVRVPFEMSDVVVEFGKNIRSLEDELDFSDYASRVYAAGQDGLVIPGEGAAINANAEAKWGRVDISYHSQGETVEEIQADAQNELAKHVDPIRSLTVSAVELQQAGVPYKRLNLGIAAKVLDRQAHIDTILVVQSIKLNLMNKMQSEFHLGKEKIDLTALLKKG